MSTDDNEDAKRSDVGYKRPPVATRFKKGGKSPNPGGRRKNRQNVFDGSIIGLIESTIPGGDRIVLESLFNVLLRGAMKGDVKAARLLMDEYKTAKGREKHATDESTLEEEAARRILGADHHIFSDPALNEGAVDPSDAAKIDE